MLLFLGLCATVLGAVEKSYDLFKDHPAFTVSTCINRSPTAEFISSATTVAYYKSGADIRVDPPTQESDLWSNSLSSVLWTINGSLVTDIDLTKELQDSNLHVTMPSGDQFFIDEVEPSWAEAFEFQVVAVAKSDHNERLFRCVKGVPLVFSNTTTSCSLVVACFPGSKLSPIFLKFVHKEALTKVLNPSQACSWVYGNQVCYGKPGFSVDVNPLGDFLYSACKHDDFNCNESKDFEEGKRKAKLQVSGNYPSALDRQLMLNKLGDSIKTIEERFQFYDYRDGSIQSGIFAPGPMSVYSYNTVPLSSRGFVTTSIEYENTKPVEVPPECPKAVKVGAGVVGLIGIITGQPELDLVAGIVQFACDAF